MKKKILLVLGDYYPDKSANGICVEKIANAFKRRGYAVDFVVNGYSDEKHAVCNGDDIYFAKTPFMWTINDHIKSSNTALGKKCLTIAKKLYAYMRLPVFLASFPSESKFYLNNVKRTVSNCLSMEDYYAVVGVNKPVEAVWGAYLAASNRGVPMFGYFLDPLAGGVYNHVVGEKRSFSRSLKVESEIMEYLDGVVLMEEHKDIFIEKYGDKYLDKAYFLGAPLLENNITESVKKKENEKKTVLYAGALYKDIRDPFFIMEAFKYIKNARLVMYVTNPCDWIGSYNTQNIEIRGRIPHDEVVREIAASDALLNIGNSDPLFAPSKVIEYLGYGKPIITTYRIDDDTSLNYIKDYDNAICIDERNDDIIRAAAEIEAFLDQSRQIGSFDELKKIYWKNDPASFVDAFEERLLDR